MLAIARGNRHDASCCAAAWQHKVPSMDALFSDTLKPYFHRRSKAKNAQEAHEAVRPTDAARQPDGLPVTEARLLRLYDLIWRRTLACQMAAARIRQVLPVASKEYIHTLLPQIAAARIQQVLPVGLRVNPECRLTACAAVRSPGGCESSSGL